MNRRRVRRFAGTTKEQARNFLSNERFERINERLGLRIPKKDAPLFEDFSKIFLELYSRVNRKTSTVLSHENSLSHLKAFFKDRRLSEITPENVARYIAERKKKVSPASVNRELSCLKCLLNRAVEWGDLETNIIVRVRKLRETPAKARILSEDEARRLIEKAAPRLKPILTLLLATGMRRGEALSLRWENVDLRRGFLYVQDGKAGSRSIPLSSFLSGILRTLWTESKSEYVFPSKAGGPTVDVKRAFKKACKDAKLKLRLHDLRHTAATFMVEAGTDLRTLAEILGHHDLRMVHRYTHPRSEPKRQAVETLAAALQDKKAPSQTPSYPEKQAVLVTPASHSKLDN